MISGTAVLQDDSRWNRGARVDIILIYVYIRVCTYPKGLVFLTELAKLFKALGDESRLRILQALCDRTYCVCDLAKRLGISQPTLSHHLKILRDTGLVNGEKDGQTIQCSVNFEEFAKYGIDLRRLLSALDREVV